MFNLSEIKEYAFQRRPDGLIVDTEILILLLVGTYNPALIQKCELTSNKHFNTDDFQLLEKVVACFKKVFITPQVLAELSNLKPFTGEYLRGYFQGVVRYLKSAEERHIPLRNLLGIEVEVICNYGFTDLSIF